MKLINTENDFSRLFGAFDDIKQQKLSIEEYKLKFKNLNEHLKSLAIKADKTHSGLTILIQGYENKARQLYANIEANYDAYYQSLMEFNCVDYLQKLEQIAISDRLQASNDLLIKWKQMETELQMRFGQLRN